MHTALSPCGELEMGAPDIIGRAKEVGLDVIGIADHNTCENFPGVSAAAKIAGGTPFVLPCIETQSAEDIHILCVFPDYETAYKYKEWLWLKIRPIKNDVDHFGYQVVIDENKKKPCSYRVRVTKLTKLSPKCTKSAAWLYWLTLTAPHSHIRRLLVPCRRTTPQTPLSSPAVSTPNRRRSGVITIREEPSSDPRTLTCSRDYRAPTAQK